MLNRRHLLISAGAAALAGPALAQPKGELSALLDRFFEEALDESPELATSLGFDKGARAAAKSKLSDASVAGAEKRKRVSADQLRRLKAVDRSKLTGMDAVNYDSVLFGLETSDAFNRAIPYGYEGGGQPYMISQLTGAYQELPDFLGSQHVVETKADADAYLSRLEAFAMMLDQETDRARRDVGLGVIPPDFVLQKTLVQMRGLMTEPSASPLVTQLATKLKDKQITGDHAAQAAKIYAEKVSPALGRQMAFVTSLQPKAVHEAGVWRLPQGDEYYRHALVRWTTTNLSADEIHQMGLEQARVLSERADVLLKGQGLTQGGVGQRIRALFDDPKHRYPNTDEAKVQLIADLNKQVEAMAKRLPQMFGVAPKAPLEIKRVPPFIEAGAPGGYYNVPTLDGSRPGIYWINLRDTAEWPKWSLPTLTYHEGIPGHHMQLAIQQEAALPMIRRASVYSAYAEGWGLYAEQLAAEMGVYENDPLGEIGYLQSALFRSARLVVDTGLHAKRWSREKAIETMTSIDGSLTSAATTEIERYCVWPGQACSYMVGRQTWLRLRREAQARMGARFDIRSFHDTGLTCAAVPLTVLERIIGDWSKA